MVIGTSHMYFSTRITWKWRGLLALGKVHILMITIRNFTNFQLHELHSNTVSLGEGFSDPSYDLLVVCNWCISSRPQNQLDKTKTKTCTGKRWWEISSTKQPANFLGIEKMCRKQNAQILQLQSPYLGGGCISTTWEVRVAAHIWKDNLLNIQKKQFTSI